MRNQKGFTLIELLIVVAIIGIIAAIAIPNLLSSKLAANEASAISSCRSLSSSQATYWTSHTPHTYGTLGELEGDGLIDSVLGAGRKSGYDFVVNAAADTWDCTASPVTQGETGRRGFFIDQTNVIRAEDTPPATVASTPLD